PLRYARCGLVSWIKYGCNGTSTVLRVEVALSSIRRIGNSGRGRGCATVRDGIASKNNTSTFREIGTEHGRDRPPGCRQKLWPDRRRCPAGSRQADQELWRSALGQSLYAGWIRTALDMYATNV